jgi:hypothetical protein
MTGGCDDNNGSNHDQDIYSNEQYSRSDEEEEEDEQLTAPSSVVASISAKSSVAGRKTSSEVYCFVKTDEGNLNSPYYCTLCSAKNQQQRWKTRNTSNFRLHLTKEHSDVYNTPVSDQSKITHFLTKTPSSSSKRKRGLLTGFNSSDKTHADNALTDWIVNHSQSFKVVEHPDFVKFCSALREEYSVPTRNTIKNRIVERWQQEKARVRAKLTVNLGWIALWLDYRHVDVQCQARLHGGDHSLHR